MCRYLPRLHLNQYAGSLDFWLENATHCCRVSRSDKGRLRHSLKMAAKASCRFTVPEYTMGIIAGLAGDYHPGMAIPPPQVSPVESADIMHGNVLITFAYGSCALYSAELLHEVFHDAEEVILPASEDALT